VASQKNVLEATLRQALKDLDACGCRWALVGGLAVGARAEPRATRDVDVAVAASGDEEAEQLVHAMLGKGYRLAMALEHDAVGRLATVRLTTKAGLFLDLLFASSGIEPEIVASAGALTVLPRLRAPVATVGHLLAMKILARDDRDRPQDADDIRELLAVASPADLRQARSALQLIARRGFHRGKRLLAELERAVRARRPNPRAAPRRRRGRSDRNGLA
jgi:Nucleotidyl transferase AbiEii toxin, Type IV TA system